MANWNKKLLFIFLVSVWCIGLVKAHIHSQKVTNYGEGVSWDKWFLALCSAALVSSCGVLPLLFNGWCVHLNEQSPSLKVVLSFAVGSLLGDVWLHLLPESWASSSPSHDRLTQAGLWTITGLFTFMIIEKIAKSIETTTTLRTKDTTKRKDISGYLNLMANCTDNFTHGLAIAASYTVSPLVGILTTLAIVCHEIPHEIGDFAILLRSGFSCPQAARAQLITATGGIIGVIIGLTAEHIGQCTLWMLPFTGGGFLYIALVSILPELIQETGHTSIMQAIGLLAGIAIMVVVTIVERKSCSAMPPLYNVSF